MITLRIVDGRPRFLRARWYTRVDCLSPVEWKSLAPLYCALVNFQQRSTEGLAYQELAIPHSFDWSNDAIVEQSGSLEIGQ